MLGPQKGHFQSETWILTLDKIWQLFEFQCFSSVNAKFSIRWSLGSYTNLKSHDSVHKYVLKKKKSHTFLATNNCIQIAGTSCTGASSFFVIFNVTFLTFFWVSKSPLQFPLLLSHELVKGTERRTGVCCSGTHSKTLAKHLYLFIF